MNQIATRTVSVYTLGCKLNFSESASIQRQLTDKGYLRTEFELGADVLIINTCSVTDNADDKCRKVIRDARKLNPDCYIIVTGCYAQLQPEQIANLGGVNAVVGAADKFKIDQIIETLGSPTDEAVVYAGPIKEVFDFHGSFSLATDRTRSFLKVQDGCNFGCSFCTIPLARGKSRSPKIEEIIEAANQIAQSGNIREIVLTGVNTGDVGIVNGRRTYRFIDLISQLDTIENIDRYRISSIEPNLLTNEVIQFVASSKTFVHHFHIPLQSGSDTILSAMNRKYNTELYRSRIELIKQLMPDACIGVDVIVGFPGESEANFRETYDFINSLDISYLHVFPYSERPNTLAIDLPGKVPSPEKVKRAKMLRMLSEMKKRQFYEHFINQTRTVLFEAEEQNGMREGFTDNYLKVHCPSHLASANELSMVKLSQLEPETIFKLNKSDFLK